MTILFGGSLHASQLEEKPASVREAEREVLFQEFARRVGMLQALLEGNEKFQILPEEKRVFLEYKTRLPNKQALIDELHRLADEYEKKTGLKTVKLNVAWRFLPTRLERRQRLVEILRGYKNAMQGIHKAYQSEMGVYAGHPALRQTHSELIEDAEKRYETALRNAERALASSTGLDVLKIDISELNPELLADKFSM